MVKAVIFDMDGTLIDSVAQHAKAWRDAFAEFGHKVAFEEVRRQIGKGGDELMPVFLSDDEAIKIGDALQARRAAILEQRYLSEIKAFPGVRALFERLIQDGRRIVLASSASANELQRYKEMAGIDDLLDDETSSDDADRSKPHPDIFQAAMQKLRGIDPNDAMAIGDTPYDAEAARGAGLRTIGVLCGGWSADELLKSGCVACYRDPADLLAHYDKSPLAKTRS